MIEQFKETAPFNISAIEAQYADAPEILEEIFSIFESETPERLENLETGAEAGNPKQVQKAAHSLANTSGTLMADRALKLARATEAAAREGELAAMRERAKLLAEEVRGILAQIESRKSSGR
jgi:HPt (histidine-containing phosphotransfer) domain-containing protein